MPQRKGYTKVRAERQNEVLDNHFEGELDVVVAMNGGDSESDEVDEEPGEENIHLGDALNKIMEQYASDIFQKLGNLTGANSPVVSYCPKSQYERAQLSVEDINTLNFTGLFCQVQYRRATPGEWETACERIWPKPTYKLKPSSQHWPGCWYYNDYHDLVKRLPKEQWVQVREAIIEKMNTLLWIPATRSDKLWNMTGNDNTWHQLPHPGAGGPHIYINPRMAGILTIALPMVQDVLALRQEEEESGSSDEDNARQLPE